MTGEPIPVTVHILDKDYVVSCPEEEREALAESARYLDQRMREARDSGKVLGTERMAVIAALNVVHELIQHRQERDDLSQSVGGGLQDLQQKIEQVLGRRRPEQVLD